MVNPRIYYTDQCFPGKSLRRLEHDLTWRGESTLPEVAQKPNLLLACLLVVFSL